MDALDGILKIEEKLVAKATLANIPLGGTFELLPLCNMNCEMCFIRLNKAEMDSIGHLRSASEWLEIAKQMKEAGTLFILLTGGEPFLYPEFIELYKGLKKLGMIITINTNATLLTEEIVQVLAKDKPRRINVTLYGASNETYEKLCHYKNGFDKTIQGIELLLKYHLDVKLNGSIVPENIHEIDKLLDIAKRYHLYMKMDTYMYPTSRERLHPFKQDSRLSYQQAAKAHLQFKKREYTLEDYQAYKEYMLKHCNQISSTCDPINCRAGKSAFWIMWYGDMTPCIFMKKPGINVFEKGFKEAWKHIHENLHQVHLPNACMSCKRKDICSVCAASTYCESNDYDEKPTYLCNYTEEILNEMRKENEKD
ncbi:MAG: radical SAM/SPASM domain-containing protein [Traorella sp.]